MSIGTGSTATLSSASAADSDESPSQWLPERLLPYRNSWRAVAVANAPMGLIASRCGGTELGTRFG